MESLGTAREIDSGAEMAIFPAKWWNGDELRNSSALQLQDAQGNPIPALGTRVVTIRLETPEGDEVMLRQNVELSHSVQQHSATNSLFWEAHAAWLGKECGREGQNQRSPDGSNAQGSDW